MSDEIKVEESTKERKTDSRPKDDGNEVVSMRQLLECGVHFGHQTKRWNSKMKRYIFTARNGIHVIDLQQSIKLIKSTYQVVKDIAKRNGTVLFVGTKKQAQEAIQDEAIRAGMPYVNHRWLGGTLTNFITILQSIKKLKKYKKMDETGLFNSLSKKESSKKRKEMVKLEYYLNGIKDMKKAPDAIFIVDTTKEQLAVQEAKKLNIPIIGIVDTNSDPDPIKYPIPANDDAIRAIKLLSGIIANAIVEGRKEGNIPIETTGESQDELDDNQPYVPNDIDAAKFGIKVQDDE